MSKVVLITGATDGIGFKTAEKNGRKNGGKASYASSS